jgi:hypothetical protein
LAASTPDHASDDIVASSEPPCRPALFTSTSRRPWAAWIAGHGGVPHAARSVTSRVTRRARSGAIGRRALRRPPAPGVRTPSRTPVPASASGEGEGAGRRPAVGRHRLPVIET